MTAAQYSAPSGWRMGLDIGGTFTDLLLVHPTLGRSFRHKVLTTYPDPAAGALRGVQELLDLARLPITALAEIVHSTTLVTNALIERRGPATGLLITAGFRDLLDLGKEQRYDAYDLFLTYPTPLIPPELRREVHERILADGTVLHPLDLAEVVAQTAALVEADITGLAIVLLHAYANPAHEEAAAAAIAAHFPGLPVSLSSRVAPRMGEWERASTTAADAYVRPLVDAYLARLADGLAAQGFGGRLSLLLSHGGAATPDLARRYPIRLLESGPAAGALAGVAVGRQVAPGQSPDLLAFDMGGTTAKACLILDGRPHVGEGFEAARTNRFRRGSGLPIATPSVDLIEIGAGGGSIAIRDALGLLQVGPHSAAADPGPACYGRGGSQPTVTDANLLLGYLHPDSFLGGRLRLDRAAAQAAVAALAATLGMTPTACAWGIHRVVNENMAAAARMHVIERGHDPRRFTLVASGGAGPAHVAGVARLLGAPRYVLPAGAGTLACLGDLDAPYALTLERTHLARLDRVAWDEVRGQVDALITQATQQLTAGGIPAAQLRVDVAADMRMVGQVHHIRIPVTLDDLTQGATATLTARFHQHYARLYVRSHPAMPLEVVGWRVTAQGLPPATPPATLPDAADPDPSPAHTATRPIYLAAADDFAPAPVYARTRLAAGMLLSGPAILEEAESTALLLPGDRGMVDAFGHILVTLPS